MPLIGPEFGIKGIMAIETLETDYLIVGAGAMGMAFADEVLARDKNADIIMVDRHARAGGHWNDAYAYVKLHQPAAFYGVNSEDLGPGGSALVTGTEVLAYYERVLEKLKATGRLRFFFKSEYIGEGAIRSLVESESKFNVQVRKKVVDASYMKVEVPSTRPPVYEVAEGVWLEAPNALPHLADAPEGYVIVGSGKTGIDAVLFLLGQGVSPQRIQWIMPNDAWLLDRARLAPGNIAKGLLQMGAFADAETLEELFTALESAGNVLRLDGNVWPTKYRCATVSEEELHQLRRIENVIRQGRVVRIQAESIELEKGTIPTGPTTLHVDCTADGLAKREVRPVFEGAQITLQSVSMCQQVFSASVIGYVETRFSDEKLMNEICQVVPHPERSKDFVLSSVLTNQNVTRWLKEFPRWLLGSRLSISHHEGILKLLIAAFRTRKAMADSNENLKRLVEREFPEDEFLGFLK
jgi:hypothetical protein